MHVVRVARRTVERLPSPVVGLVVRVGGKILLPIAGAAAAAALQRARWRIAARTSPDGTVVIDINRGLRELAPVSGTPAEPLVALAERAHVTLAGAPGGSVTHLRAVPKLAGDDIRADVALAKERLEAGE